MKKASLLLMIIILLISSELSLSNLSAYANSDNEDDYITKSVDGGVAIVGYQGESKDIDIPDKIEGQSVVAIEEKAFNEKGLTSVKIPSTVTSIKKNAFSNNLLTSVTIPEGITVIEAMAFANNQLTSVEIPSSVTAIQNYAFTNNRLTSVDISSNVTSIGAGAFFINQLTTVEIPSNLTAIEAEVFARNQLTHVTIPSSVKTIGELAFYQNRIIKLEFEQDPVSNLKTIGKNAFRNNYIPSVKIPSSVATIEEAAFSYNELTSVEFDYGASSNLKEIGKYAFHQNLLTSIKIPSSISTIGDAAFLFNQLTSVEFETPLNITTTGTHVFAYNRLTNIEIPSTLTIINRGVFSNNQLTSVQIPSSITMIDEGAFANNLLTNVEFENPSNVKTIDGVVFKNNQLTSIEIPSSVETIGYDAFVKNKLDYVIFHGKPRFSSDKTPFDQQYKEGKTFYGWFEDKDYTIKWSNTVPQPMTIYAMWDLPNICTVDFDTNGGNNVPSKTDKCGNLLIEPTNPMKEGYTFAGWYKDKGLTEAWNFNQDVVTQDITLYAKWSKVSYIVTFDANGGSKVPSQSVGHGELVKVPVAPKKEGYTFDGWHKDKELAVQWDFAKDVVTKNVTLYAKWTKDNTSGGGSGGGSLSYKVTFDSNGGSEVPSQTVSYYDLVKVPTTPVKDSYTFEGWYKDAELKNVWDFAKDRVTADIILYAKWTKDNVSEGSYIVTFDSSGGSKVPSQTVAYKALVKAPSKPTKAGHIFIGWYKNKDFTKAWDFAKDVVTEDLTLYARWMQESTGCDITFKDIDNNWAKDMIQEVASRCIIKGYPDGTFRPNDLAQRQHVVLMIDRTLQPTPIREAVSFSDVPKSHVYYEQITRLQRAGIVDGSNGAFQPNAYITRAQMAKIMVLAFGLTPEGNSTFKDVDPSHWASGYIAALADHNIALGDENGNFRPNENLTRAQFTAFMYRALGL